MIHECAFENPTCSFSQRLNITQKGVHTDLLTAREHKHWFLQHFSHFWLHFSSLSSVNTVLCDTLVVSHYCTRTSGKSVASHPLTSDRRVAGADCRQRRWIPGRCHDGREVQQSGGLPYLGWMGGTPFPLAIHSETIPDMRNCKAHGPKSIISESKIQIVYFAASGLSVDWRCREHSFLSHSHKA